jgi:GTP pyrophosphokinase
MKDWFVNKIENFLAKIKKLRPELKIKPLQQAYEFSQTAHHGQYRQSSKPYIEHPASTAVILAEMNVDTDCIIAGLLHDTLEDTATKYSELEQRFGTETANLVEGVTKLDTYSYQGNRSQRHNQAENFRKLLVSITKDIRVILIKLADRLHNMRTLEHLPASKQKRIATETLDIYAPLANRFGLAKIKWELENLCLKHLHPEEYNKIESIIETQKAGRDQFINSFIEPVKKILRKNSINAEITGRTKHIYSIFRKHKLDRIPYSDIYDLAAIRIIVNNVEQCYSVLGIIHASFQPVENSFRDFIARPKPNNYQSLHTVIIGFGGRKVEIQIRTRKMHWIAEEGIAAHWKYKELQDYRLRFWKKRNKTDHLVQTNFEKQLTWIRSFLKQPETETTENFIESLKLDLYPDIIIAISPQGDLIQLPISSTALDFAFAIHTDVGFHCEGTQVNGKLVPIRTELKSGDVVKVFTNPQAHPSKDWLQFLRTSRSRQKVRAYFREQEQQEAIELGRQIFDKKARKFHLKYKTDSQILELARQMKFHDSKTFFAQLGKGELLFSDIINHISAEKPENEEENVSQATSLDTLREHAHGIRIGDVNSLLLNYAKCCNPVPGDKILGYITRGRGITIHKSSCKNPGFLSLQKKEPERIINLKWDYENKKNEPFQVKMKIVGLNRRNFFLDVLNVFSKLKIDISDSKMRSIKKRIIGNLKFYIDSKRKYELLKQNLQKVSGLISIDKF